MPITIIFRLALEESRQREQNKEYCESFKTIHDICIQILGRKIPTSSNQYENPRSEQGSSAGKLEELRDRAVGAVFSLTDR